MRDKTRHPVMGILHCAFALLLLVSIGAPLPAWAARGFGSTDGTTTTDKIVTGHTTLNTSTTWCQFFWLTGAGGNNAGRLFEKDGHTTGGRALYYSDSFSTVNFTAYWSTTDGVWTIAAPATGAWNHLCVVYNGSSTANDPIFYLNGTTPAVTESATPAGTLETNTGAYHFGNRADGLRNLNGRVAEPAIFEGALLTLADETAMYNGTPADGLATKPTSYWKFCGKVSPEPNQIPGGSTGAVTGALIQAHPIANCGSNGRLLLGVGD